MNDKTKEETIEEGLRLARELQAWLNNNPRFHLRRAGRVVELQRTESFS